MPKRKLPRKPSALGLLLNRLPASKLFYPVYLSRQLYLHECELSLPGLPPALSGLRVAYATDMHYGAFFTRQRAIDLAEKLNALRADVIVLGGDYGEDTRYSLDFWRNVPDLHARLAVCGVIGNHDLTDAPADAVTQAMRKRGVTPLVNSALTLRDRGARFAICATDDCNMGHPLYARVIRRVANEPFVIYAPHSPDSLAKAYAMRTPPFFHLALCGHTHGGQVAFFGFAPRTSSQMGWRYGNHYRSGIVREKGVTVLVSNGVGASWLPVRLGAPPQYHLITLKSTEVNHENQHEMG